MSSDAFSAAWESLVSEKPSLDPRVQPLSEQELAEWEAIFNQSDQGGKS
jgi:hypothetical protein